ncbi:calcium-binding protein [Sulfitobacter guttiformis]|uniref:Hemolysin type calcium-binding protein n=1 Tax=Sulfitobacter guttiformis TaxID=74349 RepID=A0A420DSM1_9RHOB|nr:calcium-binding protein [Sulfitobacter guttiformis]KIN74752.1 Type I secretion target repeat protein [Sulfitobacter guttiformis KCTC 32187]RKE97324.1 hemolysin type calcium-binding protein [Sulfitobacter guttiformis]
MLWLAGLMGLMAVGAVSFIDPQANESGEDEFVDASSPEVETFDLEDAPNQNMQSNFEDDYDPRGGDDAALLPPLNSIAADSVTLIQGTNYDDLFDGTDGNDRASGQDGADTLSGGDGNDELRGDDDDDLLGGDSGNDTLHGDDGRDLIYGGDQDDVLIGHNDDDTLFGDRGNDALQGSAGSDMLDGGSGDDTLSGGLDNDTLIGGAGADVLFGGWGNDVLSGVTRNGAGGDDDEGDFLNGGGGDDTIIAGSADIVTAGEGADEIVLGDWLAHGEAAQIMDYVADDDSLLLVWDDSEAGAAEPELTLQIDPDRFDQTLILIDGTVIAAVNGTDILPGDIALVPLSSATQLDLTAA